MNDTGSIIKQLRLSLNLTQEELGKRVGLKKAAINKYELGIVENIKRQTLIDLAEALETTPNHLMGWDEKILDYQDISDVHPNRLSESPVYYFNPTVQDLAQEIYENKELQVLFDASRKLDPDDIKMITEMVKRFKKD